MAWVVTTDNGETPRRDELLLEGWEPFSVVVHPDTAQWGSWVEVWFRKQVQEVQRDGVD